MLLRMAPQSLVEEARWTLFEHRVQWQHGGVSEAESRQTENAAQSRLSSLSACLQWDQDHGRFA